LLFEKWRVAVALWSYVPQPLSAALFAAVLLQGMADMLDGDSVLEEAVDRLRIEEKYLFSRYTVSVKQ
jgi:hypothetical protein